MQVLEYLGTIFTLNHFLMMNVGVAAGIIMGLLPGINVVFAVAILLPFTFGLDSIAGVYLLMGCYCGALYGGAITAILINTPGTPSAAMTVLDGYALAQQGRAGDALNAALLGSVLGGLISCLSLIFFAPMLARVAYYIASPEYFALCVFGMSAAIGVSQDRVLKGIIMAVIGLFLSTAGIDVSTGTTRFMFDNMNLLGGLQPPIIMLGMFALTEILSKSQEAIRSNYERMEVITFKKATMKFREFFRYWKTILKSSIIGIIIGAIPGTGGAIAAMLSYNEARRSSKHPEKFGTGMIEGVLAPETGDNAVTGACLIPTLTLGIPGDAVVAVLLGALTMQGITPGAALFAKGNTWVYSIMGGLIVINIIVFLQGIFFSRAFAHITKVPLIALLPCIMILCTIGSFAISNSTFEVLVMVVAGFFGFIMKKNEFPIPPMIIAMVLGQLAEVNLRRSLMLSKNGALVFFTRPISAIIILVAFAALLYPLIKKLIVKHHGGVKSELMAALDAEYDVEEDGR